ncbi:FtsX-like permease family protein [Geomonas oryzisoli]|uniref:FtsX-like permease family protein n=1 Tax=Geomonas oryzisoli TaxID=2847992 RepID=A0ABX8JEK1_9BACT|nr:FtsX-like permease family protein [Geomonas oryzisoli]QWV93945.1 FtsX-like permease family protein [Geomonas oryzisoli]
MANMIERHRHILDFTLAALLRRKGKNGGLVLVYTLIIFVLASVLFFTEAIKREATLVLHESPEIIVQRTQAGRYQTIPASWCEEIGRINGVTSVQPRLWGYHYDRTRRANYTFMVPAQAPPQPGHVDLGSGVARVLGADIGDTIAFAGHDGVPRAYTVGTLLESESQLLTADVVLISERDYRDFSGIPAGQATDLVLQVRNPREYATVVEKITGMHHDARPILRSEIQRTYDAVFGWRSGLMIVIYSGAALAFLILSWDKATGLSAEERTEIGILKAVGWDTSDILLMKFWEGAVISLTAFLAGTIFAYIHVFFTSSALFAPVLKGWSTLYPSFRLMPVLDLRQGAALFFLTVVPYTVTTIVPSWRAATIDPDRVMR